MTPRFETHTRADGWHVIRRTCDGWTLHTRTASSAPLTPRVFAFLGDAEKLIQRWQRTGAPSASAFAPLSPFACLLSARHYRSQN